MNGGVPGQLPRLAVITDVPVAKTMGGSLLMHRLLTGYPADRLVVVQSHLMRLPEPAEALPGIAYHQCDYRRLPRLLRNKYNPTWPHILWWAMRRHRVGIRELLNEFVPEAILTVPHEYLWRPAAELAEEYRVPLHLIVHDDWPSTVTANRTNVAWRASRWFAKRKFRPIYRQAASRLCVSPGMAEQYQRWYGVAGDVLYPNRGEDSPEARVRLGRAPAGPPVLAFAGSLHTHGVHDLLRDTSACLAKLGGRLDLYGRNTQEELERMGLHAPVVRAAGFLPPIVLAERIAESAHALLLAATFWDNERVDTSTLFPSKLADYTAIGLPIVIWGPEYSSAARWGLENPAAALTVIDRSPAALLTAIQKVAADPELARRLAESAVAQGQRDFGAGRAREILHAVLRQHTRRE